MPITKSITSYKAHKMERKERLKIAYDFLRSRGVVHTQKDVASIMEATQQNVSAALKGKEGVLTDNFLRRFNLAFGDPFNIDWLINGNGEMLAHPISQNAKGDNNTQIAGNGNNVNMSTIDKALDEISEQRKLVAKSQEQIDRLLSIIENMNNK